MTRFIARFEDLPDTEVHVRSPVSLEPDDLTVELHRTHRRARSSFWTSTARGSHMVPMLELTNCPDCGARYERRVKAKEVTVHVVGPVELSPEERARLEAEAEQKVVRRYGWYKPARGWAGGGWYGSAPGTPGLPAPAETDVETAADATESVPAYNVYHDGRRVASIPAAVMEEAAAKCNALAGALGWEEYEEPIDRAEEECDDGP